MPRNDNYANGMSQEDQDAILEHSRNVAVSLDRSECGDDLPFILSVGYLGPGNAARGCELDNEIMPLIREAVEKYVRGRNRRRYAITYKPEPDDAVPIAVKGPDGYWQIGDRRYGWSYPLKRTELELHPDETERIVARYETSTGWRYGAFFDITELLRGTLPS